MSNPFMTNLEQAAVGIHEMFAAFVASGFTEDQALAIVTSLMATRFNQEGN